MRQISSPSLVTLALAMASCLLVPACDNKDAAPAKTAPGADAAKRDAKVAKADANLAKADAKSDAKADAKSPAADPSDREPRGKSDDEANAKALEEFAKSRDTKSVEVTAKPGTPEWFVQGLEAFRAGNIDPIVSNFAKDIRWDAVGSPLEPPSVGKAAVMARWEDLLIGVPDMKLHARRIFHHGKLVIMQVVLTGTHKGNFRGLAPTEKPLGTDVLVWIWHDDEGKAKEVRVVYDEASLLAQMGKLPGQTVSPIPAVPTDAPEVITGEDDAAAIKLYKGLVTAGKNRQKLCETKVCAAGLVHHDARTGAVINAPAGHQALHDGLYAAFPDFAITVKDVASFGNGWVVTYGLGKGTHTGPLGGLAATSKPVEVSFGEVARLDGGKVAESWGYTNGLEMLAELGVFTAPPAAGP